MKISHLLILASIFVSVSCTNSTPVLSGSEKFVVTDFRGKEIKMEKPAERVICLIESALSGIYMLQQQNRIIGVPSAVFGENLYPYYARLDSRILDKSLPAPGNWDFISIEQIVGLKPDLVIIWSSQSDAIENLEQFGIPVYAVMLHSFSDIYKEIKDFGILLDCSGRADSLVSFTKDEMQSIQTSRSNVNMKSVYFMWAQGITETSGINSTVNELLEAAGVRNACNLSDEHVSVSIEKIYDWDPDMIVMWYNEKLDPVDVLNDPLLQGLRAVKEGEVYELPEVFACDFWTLKMQYPVQIISNWAYDINPDTGIQTQLLREMYVQLYGKELID
ncbi:MAG: ABC transporter substrate-binding protein [Bacteroidales bacterium]